MLQDVPNSLVDKNSIAPLSSADSNSKHGIPTKAFAPPPSLLNKALDINQRVELQKTLAGIKNKNGALQAKTIASQNDFNDQKKKVLAEVFDMMKKAGIDPANLDSISAFVKKLQEQDPDLYALFENAMNSFVDAGDQGQVTPPETAPAPQSENGGLMDQYGGLQKTMMRK